jgi:hypothetical protein
MRHSLACSLVCVLGLAACGGNDTYDLTLGADGSAGAALSPEAAKCGATTVFGDLYPGIVVCGRPVLPVHISGALGDTVNLSTRGPRGYALDAPMDRAGKSCNYQYQWRIGKDPTPGVYVLTVTSSAAPYAFNVVVGTGKACDAITGTLSGTTTAGATTGTRSGGASATTTGGAGATTGGSTTVTTGGTTGPTADPQGTTSGGSSTATGSTTTGGANATTGGGAGTDSGSTTGGEATAPSCGGCGDCPNLQTCWSGACMPCSSSVFCCAGLMCADGQCIAPGG